MKGILPLILGIFSTASLAQSDSASQQATFVIDLFTKSCLANMGNNKATSTWAQKSSFARANEQFSNEVLRGQAGEVWGAPSPIGQFLVVLTGETHCATWARTADTSLVNQYFKTIANGVARPGLTVTPYIDKTIDGVGGEYRQLGFLMQKEGAPHGWVMLATTSQSKDAQVQARLTVSPVKF